MAETSSSPPKAPSIKREALAEVGYVGLKTQGKTVLEEGNAKLRFPQWVTEVEEMRKDPSIAVALLLYRMMIGRVNWRVEPPIGATEEQIEKAKIIETMMGDMDDSWGSFINNISSYIDYGFCVCEKVFKRRKRKDSKFDDGYVGWKKLPIRSQSTIKGWKFSDDGRELLGVYQSTFNLLANGNIKGNGAIEKQLLMIPREKFLLFTADTRNDNPCGNSPLKSAWLPYQYKKSVLEKEIIGISRELGGVPKFTIPAQYLSGDASPDEKAIADYYCNVARNIHLNTQSGLVLPSDRDEHGHPLFTFELLHSQGVKAYDTNAIIQRFDSQILISLFADLLQLGNNSMGSFALASSKSNLIAMAIEYRLKEIREVLNFDLIPHTFKLNGWDDTDFPAFVYSDLDDVDIGEFASAIQRLAATDSIEKDRAFYNKTRTVIGLDPYPDDEPPKQEYLKGEMTSRSGDGMASSSGGLNGTAESVSSDDNSISNVYNK